MTIQDLSAVCLHTLSNELKNEIIQNKQSFRLLCAHVIAVAHVQHLHRGTKQTFKH